MQWLDNNLLKKNPDNCLYLQISSNENIKVKIGQIEVENSACEKLFGVN